MRVAIIPARGGSKRIPRKNIKIFHGKPIIAYSIECAISSKLFDRVIVSTDDQEIAECAIKYGAEVPFLRPATLADDYAETIPVVAHAIQACESIYRQVIKNVCCIYATAPLLHSRYLQKGYNILSSAEEIDYVFAAAEFSCQIFRSFSLNKSGRCKMFWPEYRSARSQDLPKAYYDAGQFYWGTRDAFCEKRKIFDNSSAPVILPNFIVKDIDNLNDWDEAEKLYAELILEK